MAAARLTFANIHMVREPDEDEIVPSSAVDTRSEEFSVDAIYDRSRFLAHRMPQTIPVLPVLPDLRFEQAYLSSLRSANGSWWKVAYVTIRDQVLMMFLQGMFYGLLKCSYGVLKITRGNGKSFGGKIRNWWVGINDIQPNSLPKNDNL
ncbi:hypothetical protein NEOLI_004684 [Neolecta irregularis DAH-3]|uniref:Uncharacterized protein n=1 Tax=Neolecta irregularis (strain DAH-3) TaxID=1198029 RepID=A0A1U7LJR6_NEOID|nr:hypothetical protein NEOLI_004684 [Neolecta irregularis DAH-3]|eukprot:OLL22792.1 hypothetical protein NEOLI_004684 [Neolecta irregularis DAH-3]